MHEAKGLAAFFAPIQTFSKVCGAVCARTPQASASPAVWEGAEMF